MKYPHTPPPGEDPRRRKNGPQDANGKRPGEDPNAKRTPSESEEAANSGKPSPEEVINRQRSPITNQDEQEKITNTGDDDIPVADK